MVRRRRLTFGSGAMAAMARAGDGANMAGKVGEALAAVGVELSWGTLFSARRLGGAGSFFTFFCGWVWVSPVAPGVPGAREASSDS